MASKEKALRKVQVALDSSVGRSLELDRDKQDGEDDATLLRDISQRRGHSTGCRPATSDGPACSSARILSQPQARIRAIIEKNEGVERPSQLGYSL